ncbi:MAG: hypothetical protein HYU67_07490 [Flavobacteriia bacterium]|nr:hypothetical protein [Flavobacteriia bacterium]
MKYKLFLIALIVLFSCKKKEQITIPIPVSELKNGLLVLNEGLFQHNISNLTWVDLSNNAINNEFFEQKTGRKLGDTGNDIQKYGNKIYIIVNMSGTVEVLNANDGTSLKQISFVENNQNKQPRKISFSEGKAFVSCFDGYVDVIDTTSLKIIKRIKVGSNPDNILSFNQKIYVSNSGGLNFPELDSTLSVIDPVLLTEIKKITIGKNPGKIVGINQQLYVLTRGNYSTIPAKIKKVDVSSENVTELSISDPLLIEKMEDQLLVVYSNSNQVKLGKYSILNSVWENTQWISLNAFQQLYSLHYDQKTSKLYLFDAMDYTSSGYLKEYDLNGSFIQEFKCSIIPSELIVF